MLLLCFGATSQNIRSTAPIIHELISLNFENSHSRINEISDPTIKNQFLLLEQILYNQGQDKKADSIAFFNTKISDTDYSKNLQKLSHAFYDQFNNGNNELLPFKNLEETYLWAKENNYNEFLKLNLIGFLEFYSKDVNQKSNAYHLYINELNAIATHDIDKVWAKYYASYLSSMQESSEKWYANTEELIGFIQGRSFTDPVLAKIYESIGVYYNRVNNLDMAKKYVDMLLELKDVPSIRKYKFGGYLDRSEIYLKDGEITNAKKYLDTAKTYINPNDSLRYQLNLERFHAFYYYEHLKQWDSAYHYVKKSLFTEAKLDHQNTSDRISDLNIELQTEKRKRQIAQLNIDNQKAQFRNYGLIAGILFLSIGGYFLYSNSRKQQRIAVQEKELEKERADNLLKNQELASIDAMLAGQEKERKRLAGELHDSLGSKLTTLRLYIENFKKNKSDGAAFAKAEEIVNQTYDEVRSMAHINNSGVYAKDGLVPAIEKMARSISGTGALDIEVIDFGLDRRLDNQFEIILFRIIQELITNIIKHAGATEASINLTEHHGILNIVIEDNGKGFNASVLPKSDGMGLASIEKRIENMDGVMEIDSSIGNGTTITMDIPINKY